MSKITPAQEVIYRGPCDELYGQPITIPEHDCRAHIRHRYERWVETHGLDCGPYETCTEEWWECSICGEHEDDLADD